MTFCGRVPVVADSISSLSGGCQQAVPADASSNYGKMLEFFFPSIVSAPLYLCFTLFFRI